MIFLMTHIIYSQPPERELMKFSWDFSDQSGSESDDQKTEDRWFSEIDASCSSESSSTRDFSESDVGMLDFQSTLAGPLPNYLSALLFSVASAGKCDENLAQHGESGYIEQ